MTPTTKTGVPGSTQLEVAQSLLCSSQGDQEQKPGPC